MITATMTTGHDPTNNFYTFEDPLGFASPLSLSAWDNGDNNNNDDSDDDSFDDAENDDLDGDWSDNNESSHERNCLWQRDAGLASNKPIAPLLQSPMCSPPSTSAATTPFACAAAATAATSSAAAPTTCSGSSTRRVHFSPQEPEVCCYEQADREYYSILFYSAHELQKIMDAFAQEKDGSM